VKNQFYTGTPTSRRFAPCPTTVKAGDPVLLGKVPAFALDDYQAVTGGTTFMLNGTFTTTVIAESSVSPVVGAQVNPGDALYARGTLDATTNVTTGLTITATSGDTPFGHLDPSDNKILSGVTNTAALVLLEG